MTPELITRDTDLVTGEPGAWTWNCPRCPGEGVRTYPTKAGARRSAFQHLKRTHDREGWWL